MEYKQGILVADLSGYTAMTEAHGARSAAGLVKRFVELVNQSLTGNCRLVERVGDEVIILSDKVDDLLQTALKLQELTQSEKEFLAVHAGIHYGEILVEDNHIYGSTINLASRIAAHSGGGQVLCSAAAISNLKDKTGVQFKSLGPTRFKNVKEPVEIFAAAYKTAPAEKVFDPVCHMALDQDAVTASWQHENNTYYFCSDECRNSFSENPDLFIK